MTNLFLSFLVVVSALSAKSVGSTLCTLADVRANGTLLSQCDVLCKPPKWTDFVAFYLGNYFAHVATVRSEPGQGLLQSIFTAIIALLFPTSGLLRGVQAIISLAVFAPTPLQRAARAGALYMVAELAVEDQSERSVRDIWRIVMHRDASDVENRIATEAQSRGAEKHPSKPRARQGLDNFESTTHAQDGEAPTRPENKSSGEEQAKDQVEAKSGSAPDTTEPTTHVRALNNSLDAKKPACLASPEASRLAPANARRIHGRVSLPARWTLVPVPSNATFQKDCAVELRSSSGSHSDKREHQTEIAEDFSILKALIALGQALYAITTLYDTSKGQTDYFGYAAYGLTVAPFALMSLVNVVSNLFCPEYPAICLIENNALDQLRQQIKAEGKEDEYFVEGTVGKLSIEAESAWMHVMETRSGIDKLITDREVIDLVIANSALALGSGICLAIIGGLSKFEKAQSTHAQRVWTMTWFAFGQLFGIVPVVMPIYQKFGSKSYNSLQLLLGLLAYGAPAVGGFVVVGQMIGEYGICESI